MYSRDEGSTEEEDAGWGERRWRFFELGEEKISIILSAEKMNEHLGLDRSHLDARPFLFAYQPPSWRASFSRGAREALSRFPSSHCA